MRIGSYELWVDDETHTLYPRPDRGDPLKNKYGITGRRVFMDASGNIYVISLHDLHFIMGRIDQTRWEAGNAGDYTYTGPKTMPELLQPLRGRLRLRLVLLLGLIVLLLGLIVYAVTLLWR